MSQIAKSIFLFTSVILFISVCSKNIFSSNKDNTTYVAQKCILLITMDGARDDYCTSETMTNLFSFMKDSMVFKNAYSPSSWTLPSHASLFTGLYPQQHGAFRLPYEPTNDVSTDTKRRFEAEINIDNNIFFEVPEAAKAIPKVKF